LLLQAIKPVLLAPVLLQQANKANIHEKAITHKLIEIEPADNRLGQVCFKRLNSRNTLMN
jgi:hypothetical protein